MISIITITYNNYNDLIETVNSVPKKNSIEHIIVNGGHCLKTKAFLKEFHDIYIDEPDEGISDAFNKGVKISTGDAVMFLNSGDTLIDPDYPEKAERILIQSPHVDFVHAAILFSDQLIGDIILYPKMDNTLPTSVLGRYTPLRHQTMIHRRRLFEEIGEFKISQKYAMDFDWVCRWAKTNREAYYFTETIPVKMDGTGQSTVQEFNTLKEISVSLNQQFGYNLPIMFNFLIRWFYFIARQTMSKLGLKKFLLLLKSIKYKAKVN